jgi:phosphate transport system permease protein
MVLTMRYASELVRSSWMKLMLLVILLLPFAIGLSLLVKSIPFLNSDLWSNVLLSSEWVPMQGKFGLWPFIWSSILISLLGLVIMVPICLASSIYITQFAPLWISRALQTIIDILAGIPSFIFGLWGVVTIIPFIADGAILFGANNTSGYSILAGALVVAVSVMPFVLNMLIELFRSVPIELKEAALSLGTSHWQMIKDVVVKKIRPGITAAFTLGVSKAFGETIAVVMVVGNVVQVPHTLFDAGYPLPALLANNYGEMMSIPMYESALMLCALILLVIVIAFNYVAHRIIRFYQDQN